jgi:hypothetical protein
MSRRSTQIFKSMYKSTQKQDIKTKLTKSIQHFPPKILQTVETTQFRKTDHFENAPLYKQTLQITSPAGSIRSPPSTFSQRRFSPSVLKTPFEIQTKGVRPKSAPSHRTSQGHFNYMPPPPPPIVKTINSKKSVEEQQKEDEERMKLIYSEIEKMSFVEMEELVDMIYTRCQSSKFFEDHNANMWNTFMQKKKHQV